jgi:hypothetical protein
LFLEKGLGGAQKEMWKMGKIEESLPNPGERKRERERETERKSLQEGM